MAGRYSTEERLEKGQYTDGEKWYTSSGYAIRGTEGDYSGIMDVASEEATQTTRDAIQDAKRVANLEYNLGSNWQDIYDLESRSYKDGYSASDGNGGRLSEIYQSGIDYGSRPAGVSGVSAKDYAAMTGNAGTTVSGSGSSGGSSGYKMLATGSGNGYPPAGTGGGYGGTTPAVTAQADGSGVYTDAAGLHINPATGGSSTAGSSFLDAYGDQLEALQAAIAATQTGYDEQIAALKAAMESERTARQASHDAAKKELEEQIAAGRQQAYINSQMSMAALPQAMAAAGYTGGVTETTAANIRNDYQNALTDLDRALAQQTAALQMELANGLSESDSQYQTQIAGLLGEAGQSNAQYQLQVADLMAALEQQEYQRQLEQTQLEMAQRAAALEEQQYQQELLLRQQAAALEEELARQELALAWQQRADSQAASSLDAELARQELLLKQQAAALEEELARRELDLAWYKAQQDDDEGGEVEIPAEVAETLDSYWRMVEVGGSEINKANARDIFKDRAADYLEKSGLTKQTANTLLGAWMKQRGVS